jgi:nicotinamidase-related amidase
VNAGRAWTERSRACGRRGNGKDRAVARALLLVDVIKDFEHEDGDRLLASFRQRHPGLVRAVERAREDGATIVYANDNAGKWRSEAPSLIRRALEGKGGELVGAIAPRSEDLVVLKPRYSAFDDTPLASLLEDCGVRELTLAGTVTEMCVFQTATDAVRHGFEVAVQADACATVDEVHEALALSYLEQVVGLRVLNRPGLPR